MTSCARYLVDSGFDFNFSQTEDRGDLFVLDPNQAWRRMFARYKILVLGGGSVGKSSLVSRFVDDRFSEEHRPTMGFKMVCKSILLDHLKMRIHIFDTSGQRCPVRPFYYQECRGAIVVYDVTDKASFESMAYWLDNIERHSDGRMIKMIIGKKCDLRQERVVDFQTASDFAHSVGACLIETSAKESVNIEETFVTLATMIYRDQVRIHGSPV